MRNEEYHPIRKKAFWVGLIQWLAAGAAMIGLATEAIVDGWAEWLTGGITLLVMAGVLRKGTTDSEQRTTPLDASGEPLNNNYTKR